MGYIHFVRHGQAQFGLDDYDALSAVGMEQSKYLGEVFNRRAVDIAQVISGTMKRQLQTAESFLQGYGKKYGILQLSAWNEFDHRNIIAKYEARYSDISEVRKDVASAGDPKQKVFEILYGAVKRWTTGKENDYNESWTAFCERIEQALQQMSEEKGNAIIFTSGGAIAVALKHVLGLSAEKTFELQLLIANASVTTLKTSSRGLQLLAFNDHSYFHPEHKSWITFR
jgi:broad specificity phosphatase PhoE